MFSLFSEDSSNCAIAKAASDEEATMKEAVAEAVKVQAAVDATKIERAAKAIRVYEYEQMCTVAAIQNSRWCLVVWSRCELLGI